jgi:beta-glucosidase
VYEKGCEFFDPAHFELEKAVKAAKEADVTVLVLGDCSSSHSGTAFKNTSGENSDYATLILPGNQQKLLEAVCETGKPVVLILQAGRPFNLAYASEHCEAILVNWLPGQEGGPATADVLFGNYNPGGRLPMTFPRDISQLPLYYNFKTSGRRYEYADMEYYPLYSFGFGLSYTTFAYSNPKTVVKEDGTIEVQATVTNTGKISGSEVVQLYVTDMYASVKTRVMELKDFTRIILRPGESKTVSFTLTPYQLSVLNDRMDRVVEKGDFKIMIGGTSPSYVAADRIKDSVGYRNEKQGVTATVDYPYTYGADFTMKIAGIEDDLTGKKKRLQMQVKNTGDLTDTGKISMYVDGVLAGDVRHYELDPNEEKTIRFIVDKPDFQRLLFVTKYKSLSYDTSNIY